MKKYIAIIITILISIFIISNFVCISNAVGLDKIQDPEKFTQSSEDNKGIVDIGNIIVWAVRLFGESIAVIMLLIIGIKYVLASVEEKAEYKQSIWPYVIGAALIFAGAEITNIIYKAFNG